MAQPDFWNDNEQAQKVIAENNILKEKRDTFVNLRDQISDLETSLELLAVEPDDDLQKDFEASFTNTQKALEQYRLTQLLDGEYDAKNAILEIHPGAGGTEAQDWGEMLLRMYIRWGEQHAFSVETASYEAGDEAGIVQFDRAQNSVAQIPAQDLEKIWVALPVKAQFFRAAARKTAGMRGVKGRMVAHGAASLLQPKSCSMVLS